MTDQPAGQINVEKVKDARTGPLCSICGQPEEGHPKATDNAGIHDFVAGEGGSRAPDTPQRPAPDAGKIPGQV